MRKMSYTPKVDRFLTRGPRETPDILAQHHPQCYVKTERETEGDEGSGGEQKETERTVGDQQYPDCAVNRSCPGNVWDLRGPNNSCGSPLHTLTYTYSWVRQSKHAMPDDLIFFSP